MSIRRVAMFVRFGAVMLLLGCGRPVLPAGAPRPVAQAGNAGNGGEPAADSDGGTTTGDGGQAGMAADAEGGHDSGFGSGGGVDGGGGPDGDALSDSGAAPADTGPAPAHGDSKALTPSLSLGGGCDVDLAGPGRLNPGAGTLPAPGPYRPCVALAGHDYLAFRLSGDGRRLAVLTTTGQAFVLDSRTLTPLAVLTRARGRYTEVALSADGSIAAAASDIDGELDVWNVGNHALIRALDLATTWPTLGGALAVSRDGARVATTAGTSIVVVEVATGAIRELPASRIATALYFVNGDRELAFGGGHFWSAGTGYARTDIVNLETGSVETLVQHDDIYGTEQLEASADGTTLLTFGHGELAVWDVVTRRKHVLPQPAWEEGTFKVYGLSADGREIATSLSDSQTVWFQRRRTIDDSLVEEIRIEGASTRPYAWSSRERLLIVEAASDDGTVALAAADLATAKVAAKACSPPPSRAVAFSADGTRLRASVSSGAEDAEAVYDVATGQSVWETLSGPKWSASGGLQSGWLWSPDWRWSAWTSEPVENGMVTKQVHLMPVEGGGERTVLEWHSPNYGVEIAFSPDSRSLAVVDGPNHLLTVLDTETGAQISRQSLPGMNPWLIGFTADGSSVLVETDDRMVRTARWMDGASTAELMVGDDYVRASANGTLVVFGQGDAITYRDSVQLAKMPGIGDFCFGFIPGATLSDDGTTVALEEECSRPYDLSRAPHVDIRSAATGELLQEITIDGPVVLSPDGSMFADRTGLLWCR